MANKNMVPAGAGASAQRTQPRNAVFEIKRLLNTDEIKRRFTEILGQKAPQFMASITNAVSSNSYLQNCDANSVLSSALVAATYDLPIDSNLGFSAIVPYKGKAQFQMMYKGFIQLAIRSGNYAKMNCSDVYEDELRSFNPITGEVTFVDDFSRTTQRASGDHSKIIGYYAWFRLTTGFSQELYMSREEVQNHAKRYSQAYQYDLRAGSNSSRWSTDFDAMARKTVIKQLLSRWGILSIEMQRAMVDDQQVFDGNGVGSYDDNPEDENAPAGDKVIDVFAEPTDGEAPAKDEPAKGGDEADFAAFDAQFGDDGQLPWAED